MAFDDFKTSVLRSELKRVLRILRKGGRYRTGTLIDWCGYVVELNKEVKRRTSEPGKERT